MRIDKVVVNASPLITLFRGGQAGLLPKQRGLIISVAEGLNRLRQAGLWLSDDVARLLLKRAGE